MHHVIGAIGQRERGPAIRVFRCQPNLVNDPNTAYEIMARGMCTGEIFANHHRFSDFFQGSHTDYVNARRMVNPGAKHANKVEVAKIAEKFEAVLLSSKVTGEVAKQ